MEAAAAAATLAVEAVELETSRVVDGRRLPACLQPVSTGGRPSVAEAAAWVEANRDEVLRLAKAHGAVFLRGFGLATAQDFAAVFDSLHLGFMPYVGGAAVRTNVVGDRIFTANESPPSEPIPPHHELAQTPSPPDVVCFFCEIPAASGGATPLYDSLAVAKYVAREHADLYAALLEHGVRYTRVLPADDDPSSAIGRSWRSTYQCSSRDEAEARMREQGTSFEWLDDGCLRTTTKALPAVRRDPVTGETVFYNQVLAAHLGWTDSRNDPARALSLGNGAPIDATAVRAIAAFATEHCSVAVPWVAGDVMIVDNWQTMHARQPFVGPRRVLAALGRGIHPTPAQAERLRTSVAELSLSRTGDRMPAVGLGMWKVPNDAAPELVASAIRAGWRHLDCACDYGNEAEVGEGIRLAIERGFIRSRAELFLTGKLWCTFHAPEHVELALRRTLTDLGTEYVDLWIIHFPISLRFVDPAVRYPPGWFFDPAVESPRMEVVDVPLSATWAEMERMVDLGLARNIGLSNYNVQSIRDLCSYARIKPQVLQVELHPFLAQDKLVRFCREAGMVVVGFSPLGAGSYVSLGMAAESDSALRHPAVTAIATRLARSPAQILLRWGVQRGTAVIPKTSSLARLRENLDVFDFALTDADMAAISALNCNRRFNDPGVFCEAAFHTFCPIYE